MKKETLKFLEILKDKKADQKIFGLDNVNKIVNESLEYLFQLKPLELKRIFGDDYWVNHRMYSLKHKEKSNPIKEKSFGIIIRCIIFDISRRAPKLFSIIKSHGKGLILYYALECCESKDIVNLGKRALKDRDRRTRLKAVNLLPIKKKLLFKNDSVYEIRMAVRTKVLDFYPEEFLDSEDLYTRHMAMIRSDLNKFDWKGYLEKFKSNIDSYEFFNIEVKVAESLIRRVPYEDLLFLIDLNGYFNKIDQAFIDRFNNKWS